MRDALFYEGKNMAKEKEILRLHLEGFSQREICKALRCGHARVNDLVKASCSTGLTWEAVKSLDDSGIRELLLPSQDSRDTFALPDFESLAHEISRPGVTRKLLWYEYCNSISDTALAPYQYAQFCRLFDRYLKQESATMRLTHVPGQRMFVDWAGGSIQIVDPITGESFAARLFVASFPYSSAMFCRAYPNMSQRFFLDGHMDAFDYFGGVARILVPDNCKTAASKATIYLTEINQTYHEFATYYGTAVVPARIKRPNDKAAVEGAVLTAERQIIAVLRNRRFFSVEELNEVIDERIDIINQTPYQKRDGSRWSVFTSEEKEHLGRIARERFEIPLDKKAKVSLDYHIQVETMRYSVPYRLIGEHLDVRLTSREVTISKGGEVLAVHRRMHGRKGQCSTRAEHMPPAHLRYDQDWSPARFTSWAEKIGPKTLAVIEALLSSKSIVEQAYVPAANILNLAKGGRRDLLESACAELLKRTHLPNYSAIKHVMAGQALAKRVELSFTSAEPERSDALGEAGLVRGACYYASAKRDEG